LMDIAPDKIRDSSYGIDDPKEYIAELDDLVNEQKSDTIRCEVMKLII